MSLFLLFLLLAPVSASAKDLGELSASPYQQNSKGLVSCQKTPKLAHPASLKLRPR